MKDPFEMPYGNDYFAARESWRDWRIEAHELLDGARVRAGMHVLEIGCGGGGLLRLVSARGAYPVGVDTQQNALELARARDPVVPPVCVVRVAAGAALPFRPGAFDALVGQHVLEHLPDVRAELCEWRRVLAPGGRIALATPNARYPDPSHYADSDHAHIFAMEELRELMSQAGFAIQASTTIFAYFAPFRLLTALGVVGYRLFRRIPYFADRGRTILISARKAEMPAAGA